MVLLFGMDRVGPEGRNEMMPGGFLHTDKEDYGFRAVIDLAKPIGGISSSSIGSGNEGNLLLQRTKLHGVPSGLSKIGLVPAAHSGENLPKVAEAGALVFPAKALSW